MIEPENVFSEKEVETDLFYAFDRIIHQSFYVINCAKKEFLQISENNTFFCGQSSQKIKEMNFHFFQQCIPSREQLLVKKIFKAITNLLVNCPPEKKKDYVFKCNLHIKNGEDEMFVCHTATPVKLSKSGAVELMLCMTSLPLNKKVGYLEAYDGTTYWNYNFKANEWECANSVELTSLDRKILYYAARGHNEKEIATKVNLSVSSIKAHKQMLFEQLEAKSTQVAILTAMQCKIL